MRMCDERAVASAIAKAATAAVRPVYVVLSISVNFALSKYVNVLGLQITVVDI